jgi:Holliday junction resolvasome RuvABC endonuclease subunit
MNDELRAKFGPVFSVVSFDPPAETNMGWAILRSENGVAHLVESGVHKVAAEEGERLLGIQQFAVDLVDRHGDVAAMCFERAIGRGFDPTREKLGENTGVLKLVGYSYGIEVTKLHTMTMAKLFTGSGAAKGKKSRIKETARDLFFPGAKFRGICPDGTGESFEHQADAIGFACCFLLSIGVSISGLGGTLIPES